MPDLTVADAARLDAKRAVFASMSRLYALKSKPGDKIGWEPVELRNSLEGRIFKNWFPEDHYDTVSITIAERPPVEEPQLELIGAFGYVRDYRRDPKIRIYTFANREPEISILGSHRLWTFHVSRSNDVFVYVPQYDNNLPLELPTEL